jgi:hypothetical protein
MVRSMCSLSEDETAEEAVEVMGFFGCSAQPVNV